MLFDFERCHIVSSGKNVTQFVEFMMRHKKLFSTFGFTVDKRKLRSCARLYKKDQSKKNLQNIEKLLGL